MVNLEGHGANRTGSIAASWSAWTSWTERPVSMLYDVASKIGWGLVLQIMILMSELVCNILSVHRINRFALNIQVVDCLQFLSVYETQVKSMWGHHFHAVCRTILSVWPAIFPAIQPNGLFWKPNRNVSTSRQWVLVHKPLFTLKRFCSLCLLPVERSYGATKGSSVRAAAS